MTLWATSSSFPSSIWKFLKMRAFSHPSESYRKSWQSYWIDSFWLRRTCRWALQVAWYLSYLEHPPGLCTIQARQTTSKPSGALKWKYPQSKWHRVYWWDLFYKYFWSSWKLGGRSIMPSRSFPVLYTSRKHSWQPRAHSSKRQGRNLHDRCGFFHS